MTAEEKLDRIVETTTDIRLAVATLAGEVRNANGRIDEHERSRTDVEVRLRAVERRLYALPSLAAVLGAAGLVVAIWDKIT
jgi:uncharacterized protein YlxW (UPF0749 family)